MPQDSCVQAGAGGQRLGVVRVRGQCRIQALSRLLSFAKGHQAGTVVAEQARIAGRLFIDRNMLRAPIIGDLLRKQAVSRFTRTLSTLLQSGVPAVHSLEITRTVVGNRVIADATDHVRTRIMEGTDIATPLKSTGVFPAMVGYMVAIGEQSGELEQMLDRIADAYDEEIEVEIGRAHV